MLSSGTDNMIENFLYIEEYLSSDKIHFSNFRLNSIFKDYLFLNVPEYANITQEQTEKISQNIKKSKVIIIDEIDKQNNEINKKYLIIGFEKSLIIHERSPSSVSFVNTLLSFNSDVSICFLSDKENILRQNRQISIDDNFSEEIKNFSNCLQDIMFYGEKKSVKTIWQLVTSCISGYLIKKSYLKLPQYRITQFFAEIDRITVPKIINEDEFIILRLLGTGSFGNCYAIYLIEQEELCVIKKANGNNIEEKKLIERETANYLKIRHPLLPKFIGTIKNTNYIVIEFINGKTLTQIKQMELTYDERNTIIFELMVIFWYFHSNELIYRDLKTNNVIIDENKTVVLIDFDRLVENNQNYQETLDLFSQFMPPEYIKDGIYSYKGDIYSLGMMLKYIMTETILTSNSHQSEDSVIEDIICMCTNETVEKRPTVLDIIQKFIIQFQSNIRIENMFKKYDEYQPIFETINKICKIHRENGFDQEAQFNLGVIYSDGKYVARNFDKAIHYFSLAANRNHPKSQFNLGCIYYEGKYVTQDIDKAIHYFSLAANQNNSQAQFNLGVIYDEGKYVTRDIKKAIHYFSLAANQNIPQAQFNLGAIYYEGKYVAHDIDKAIYYLSLAANQNIPQAQYILGVIYYEGKYVAHDIDKAIYYYSLAANQNISQAQYILGMFYYEGKYVAHNINKAIYYYSLAANQNDPFAQFNLGSIYFEGEFVKRDINKAIHYYSLAANQNYPQAQFKLGYIYHEGKYATRDINKAIHYYSLAANQNISQAQFNLGVIYYEGKYVAHDIDKAIYYYSLAANQNFSRAQCKLGVIYDEGVYVKRDIDKAIHYYLLAANQNHPGAQFNLGLIYYEGKYVTRDINKAIHYYSLAANQNLPQAQFKLGSIYFGGEFVKRDINKAIHYYSLAANQNHPRAQFNLGLIYYTCSNFLPDIKKGRYYIMLASKNRHKQANFAHGFLLHEGKNIERNIEEAVHYYKEASSFNNQYAKNNLGIIYKHGYSSIKGRAGNAIVYFDEAIRQKSDYLSMYNLAHIHVYDETIKQDIDKSIDLLIRSSRMFAHSTILLTLVLIKRNGFNLEAIKQEIISRTSPESDLPNQICRLITDLQLFNASLFTFLYEYYRTRDFLYNIALKPVLYSDLNKIDKDAKAPKYPNAKDISSEFYNGFGQDLLQT